MVASVDLIWTKYISQSEVEKVPPHPPPAEGEAPWALLVEEERPKQIARLLYKGLHWALPFDYLPGVNTWKPSRMMGSRLQWTTFTYRSTSSGPSWWRPLTPTGVRRTAHWDGAARSTGSGVTKRRHDTEVVLAMSDLRNKFGIWPVRATNSSLTKVKSSWARGKVTRTEAFKLN